MNLRRSQTIDWPVELQLRTWACGWTAIFAACLWIVAFDTWVKTWYLALSTSRCIIRSCSKDVDWKLRSECLVQEVLLSVKTLFKPWSILVYIKTYLQILEHVSFKKSSKSRPVHKMHAASFNCRPWWSSTKNANHR